MTALSEAGCSYALLADGTTITIRPARPGDYEAVKRLHEAMSPDNLYLRFFSVSPRAAVQEARRVSRADGPGHGVLLGFLGDDLVGVTSYESPADRETAEVAFAVADGMHGRGVATLLLEHLVSLARERGVRVFTASTLPENTAMLRVFADAGLTVTRRLDNGVVELSMPIPRSAALSEPSRYLDAVAGREQRADVASLEPLFAPRSVAVIGASHRPGSIGRSILLNIRNAGFAGTLHAVNSRASDIDGIPSVPAPAALPEPPDLAVVTVPANAAAAGACVWSDRTASGWPCRPSGWTPRSPRIIPRRARPAWPSSPAAWAWPCSSTFPGWASASPRSPPSATSSTCPGTTCSSGGRRTA